MDEGRSDYGPKTARQSVLAPLVSLYITIEVFMLPNSVPSNYLFVTLECIAKQPIFAA